MEDTRTWGAWKAHGNATELVYFGADRKKPWAEGKLAKVVKETAGTRILDAVTGKPFENDFVGGWRGFASRFWAAPAPAEPEVAKCAECDVPEGAEHEEWCSATDKPEPRPAIGRPVGSVPAPRAHLKSKALDGNKCRCTCGKQVNRGSTFLQGHDARWVSQMVQLVQAGTTTRASVEQQLAEVSPRLAAKGAAMLDKRGL